MKWEYLQLNHAIYWSHHGQAGGYWSELISALNELGQDGWELAGFRGKDTAILKRPIEAPPTENHYHYHLEPSPLQWDIPPVRCASIARSLEHW